MKITKNNEKKLNPPNHKYDHSKKKHNSHHNHNHKHDRIPKTPQKIIEIFDLGKYIFGSTEVTRRDM